MIARLAAAALAAALAGCATAPEERTYANPLTSIEFADPSVLRAPDGAWYAYATQGRRDGRVLNIQVARSADLVAWQPLGDALPEKPRWGSTKQWFWAPHVLYDARRGLYFMYYSAEPDAHQGKCLGVAISPRPEGPFADRGSPLVCGPGIEHIDPMAFDDPATGMRLLYWGSGREPIRVQELAPDRIEFAPGSMPRVLLRADPARPYRSLIEAPWMHFRAGWYYLFYSGDRCCASAPSYAVMVARSRSALGPFEDLPQPVLQRNETWLAPGHCAIVQDEAGSDWMLYHAIDPARAGNARLMLLDRIDYADGWPAVGTASISPQPAPRAGPTRPR